MSVDMSKIDPRWELINGKRTLIFHEGMTNEEDFRECVIRAHPEIGISVVPANEEEEKRAKLNKEPENERFFVCTVGPDALSFWYRWEIFFNSRVDIIYTALDSGEILTTELFAGGLTWGGGVCPFSS